MVINEDFFDSETVDVEVKDDNRIQDVDNTYQHTLSVLFKTGEPKLNYMKTCLSNVPNFEFSDVIKIEGTKKLKEATIEFNSTMTSLENVKMLFLMLYKATVGVSFEVYFDDGLETEIDFYDYMTKRIISVLAFPKDTQYDRSDFELSSLLRKVSDMLCNRSGVYPDFFFQLEVYNCFKFPRDRQDYRNNIIDMKKNVLRGFQNQSKFDIECPRGKTSRVYISYKRLFDLIDNFDFNTYSVTLVFLTHKLRGDTNIAKHTVNNKHPFAEVVNKLPNSEDMLKRKKFLMDEYSAFTAIKINNSGYNDICLVFPIYEFYNTKNDSDWFYYLIIKWDIVDFPNHLKMANEIFEKIII